MHGQVPRRSAPVRRRLAALLAITVVAAGQLAPLVQTALATGSGGGLAVTAVDPAGTVLVGTCFELYTSREDGTLGKLVEGSKRCDQARRADGTAGPQDGQLDGTTAWSDLPAGGYFVRETLPPALAGTAATYEVAPDTAISITAGAVSQLRLVHRPTAGLTLHKVDGAGRALPGACFALIGRDGRTGAGRSACDGPRPAGAVPPGDGVADGLLVFTALAPEGTSATYTLRELVAPPGYVPAPDATVIANLAAPTELTITDTTGAGGGLAVTAVDPAGTVLVGTCFELYTSREDGTLGKLVEGSKRCDQARRADGTAGPQDGQLDGTTAWSDLPAGGYFVRETLPPALAGTAATYEVAPDTAISITAGAVSQLRLVHRPTAGLTLHKVDGAGRALPGACFALIGRDGRTGAGRSACDGPRPAGAVPPGDGVADGLLVFTALAPEGTSATYTLRELVAPPGYVPAPDATVIANLAAPTELTITDTTGAGGGLAVTAVDPAGTVLVGTCFELYTSREDGTLGKLVEGSKRCDQARRADGTAGPQDGQLDGTTAWSDLPAGGYFVRETLPPALAGTAATYEVAPDTAISITAGAVSQLRLVHRPTAGLTLHKVDGAGRALPGACFALIGRDGRTGAGRSACDGPRPAGAVPPGDGVADGLLVFTALAPEGTSATYTLRELVAPPGYVPAPDATVIVAPGRITEGTLANTTGGTTAPGGGGGKPIIGLELEIDSTIAIDKFGGYPSEGKDSKTSASGHIPLTGDETAGWQGSGTLASSTHVTAALQCAKLTVTGEGTYDWTVFGVHAGPSVAADAITVDMDAGQATENPDMSTTDACGTSIESPTNTWENLFFVVYSPDHYKGRGYRIDHWKAIGGPEVWTSGGVIAEATWAGSCPTLFDTQACSADTTFRLTAVVTGTAPAPSASAQAPAAGPIFTPLPLPGETSAGPTPPGTSPAPSVAAGGPVDVLLACTDMASCLTSPVGLVVLGIGVIVLVGGGALLMRSRLERNQKILPLKVEPPTLGATATDLEIEGISLDADKVSPGAQPADYDKLSSTSLDGVKLVEPRIDTDKLF